MGQLNTKPLTWGILGTATIAVEQVIPALLNSENCTVEAIASRSLSKAKHEANRFEISTFYDDYEALLDNGAIEAVYIPLPNHLHVEWAIKALQKGKHVLLEKPVGMTALEAEQLEDVSLQYPHLKIMEAFMYRFHPQWDQVLYLVAKGAIGEVTLVESSFCFFEDDPKIIVNRIDFGGGSLMDVGCYPVSVSRLIFGSEPISVTAHMDIDKNLKIDLSTCGILEFEKGKALIHSSIRQFENQTVKISGLKGQIEVAIPFNPKYNEPSKVILINHEGVSNYYIEPCNQYVLQVDSFAKSVRNNSDVAITLDDSIKNMHVIDALKESGLKQTKIYL